MDKMLQQVSRILSYALRHHPEEFGIILDEEGWVLTNDLLNAIKKNHPALRWIDSATLQLIQQQNDKPRFEMIEGSIRAGYGHSLAQLRIRMIPHKPPAVLYHGTTEKALLQIRQTGLQPQQRHYVHLSADIQTARLVGKRRTKIPQLITINASDAFHAGIQFYKCNETIWLADGIPPQYLGDL